MDPDERVAVRTYIPRYQKEIWEGHATDLEMSLSEYVRTMVQAGRRPYEIPGEEQAAPAPTQESGDDGYEDRIRSVLETRGALDWDDLVEALVDDVEADLDASLEQLQDENEIRYSGRDGGYVLNEPTEPVP